MCEDRRRGAEAASLSPREGWASQLRAKDVASDGWQEAAVTAGSGREDAPAHWGPEAAGVTDRRKQGKEQA